MYLITVCNDISGQAKAKGKQEYSSISVNKNQLQEEDGRGWLVGFYGTLFNAKSIFI